MVKLWDLMADTGAAGAPPVRLLKGHRGRRVHGIAFAPDGRRLASAGSDGTGRVWELRTDREVLQLTLPLAEVSSVAFAPDGRHLVAAGNKVVRVWDATPPGPLGALPRRPDTAPRANKENALPWPGSSWGLTRSAGAVD